MSPTGAQGRNRRIGERHELAVPIEVTLPSAGRWRRAPKPLALTSRDLSISGASFACDMSVELRPNLALQVTLGDVTGTAVVRNVHPQNGQILYGVEFTDPRLSEVAARIIDERVQRPAAGRDEASAARQKLNEAAAREVAYRGSRADWG